MRPRLLLLLSATAALSFGACGGDGGDPEEGAGAAERPIPDGPNVLLFVIDTLRADRLGTYGNEAGPSPHLDALADESVLFEHAIAQAPYTAASHASLFTSTHPVTHGVWNRIEFENGHKAFPALSDEAVTLAEVLYDAGWQTAAIADGGFVNERRGLHQGFELFESETLWVENRVNRALAWLDHERDEERPFFLFLHTYEPHYPYLPEEKYVEQFAEGYEGRVRDAVTQARAAMDDESIEGNPIDILQKKYFKPIFSGEMTQEEREFVLRLYDAEIAMTDAYFQKVVERLEATGELDNTILIVTSDHGEQFWEHGKFGHQQVYEEQLRIPLFFRVPGVEPSRREGTAELLDVMPTLLAELGLDAPDCLQGIDLDLRSTEPLPSTRRHFSAANWPEPVHAYYEGPFKLLFWPQREAGVEIFDRIGDPGETNDLSGDAQHEALVVGARRWLAAYDTACDEIRQRCRLFPTIHALTAFDPGMIKELAALGYIDPDSDDEEQE